MYFLHCFKDYCIDETPIKTQGQSTMMLVYEPQAIYRRRRSHIPIHHQTQSKITY